MTNINWDMVDLHSQLSNAKILGSCNLEKYLNFYDKFEEYCFSNLNIDKDVYLNTINYIQNKEIVFDINDALGFISYTFDQNQGFYLFKKYREEYVAEKISLITKQYYLSDWYMEFLNLFLKDKIYSFKTEIFSILSLDVLEKILDSLSFLIYLQAFIFMKLEA